MPNRDLAGQINNREAAYDMAEGPPRAFTNDDDDELNSCVPSIADQSKQEWNAMGRNDADDQDSNDEVEFEIEGRPGQ